MIGILAMAFVAFLLTQKLAKITKLEVQIIYIILGIVIGVIIRGFGYGSLEKIVPEISTYNSVALLLMFFTAGFSIDLDKLKKSGAVTGRLMTMPAYGELVIVTILIMAMGGILKGRGFSLGIAEAMMVAAIFATASPANVIPVCMEKISQKKNGSNNLPSTMILTTVVDGFITVPVIFAAAFVFITTKNEGHVRNGELVKLVLIILAGLICALVIGAIIGKIESIIFRRWFVSIKEKHHGKLTEYLLTIIVFSVGLIIVLGLAHVKNLKILMTLFGILVVLGIGFGIGKWDKTGTSVIIKNTGNRLFYVVGMPVIFIYVGANIDLSVLLDLKLLGLLVIITGVAVLVKGKIAKIILKDNKYTNSERKFAARCFIPKGVGLSNFSVIFGAVLGSGEDVVQFMTMLAAVSIVITMSVGIGLLSKTDLST